MIADAKYLEGLWRQFRAAPATLPRDWQNAFGFVEQYLLAPDCEERLSPSAPVDSGCGYLDRFGHLHARLDPLGLAVPPPLPRAFGDTPGHAGSLGIETGHLDSPEMVDWVVARSKPLIRQPRLSSFAVYDSLLRGEAVDQLLARKYPAKKRFGGEGAEAIVPLVHAIFREAAEHGVDEIVIGAMHRGRLGLLTSLGGFGIAELVDLMTGTHPFADEPHRAADVPYHLGRSGTFADVPFTYLANPSHLEAINPVAVGVTRARRAAGSGRAMALILHTDASVVGQGVNAELLQMSALAGYEVGGTIHVVINNQLGFTTDPTEARTSRYCTGPWRAVDSLLVHVNGDDVDAAVASGGLALAFRERFRRDAVIDVVCYRANGHNEIDEPRFTQPTYYRAADVKLGVCALYERKLVADGVLTADRTAAMREAARARLEGELARGVEPSAPSAAPMPRSALTPATAAAIRAAGEAMCGIPASLGHPKLVAMMAKRGGELDEGIGWAFAEQLALATLIGDGVPVRVSGQDVERGAFSQRHWAIVSPADGSRHHPLRSRAHDATLEIVNSPLSEYATLGFEYGVSLARPGAMTIWEAQFGDFANGAQIVIDQFIASGFEKWQQASNLTVLLPHGLEGQGPEHSSARIERVLQLCAGDNIRVMHPSTPANFFHLLRSQAGADRPLFAFTPKSLLRMGEARSPLDDFTDGAGYLRAIGEPSRAAGGRAILCSGKIAYELRRARDARDSAVAIIRIEALYPFPEQEVIAAIVASGAHEIVWLQEEPENFGAGTWLAPRLARIAAELGKRWLPMVARPASPSPAGSFHARHDADQQALLVRAMETGA